LWFNVPAKDEILDLALTCCRAENHMPARFILLLALN
jgi:hypothetical protein